MITLQKPKIAITSTSRQSAVEASGGGRQRVSAVDRCLMHICTQEAAVRWRVSNQR